MARGASQPRNPRDRHRPAAVGHSPDIHITKGDAVVVTDVGQAQMWAAQHFWYDRRNTFFSSGGLGAMGYAFPASIGVKFARPNEQVWCIIGDGGFQMTLQDLAVVKEHNVDVKIAIINNSHLGMIRQWQTPLLRRSLHER